MPKRTEGAMRLFNIYVNRAFFAQKAAYTAKTLRLRVKAVVPLTATIVIEEV